MIDILKNATQKCKALSQKEALEKIVSQIEKDLQEPNKENITH